MPNQEIGVKSIWSNKSFTPGLNAYLTGLTKAIAATNSTVAAITSMGASTQAAFNQITANSRALVTALQAITAAAKAASAAAAKVGTGRAPKVQIQNVINPVSGTVVQQINAATAATRNLGNQAQKTSVNLQTLSSKSIALGTAIGTIAGNALLGFARGLSALGGQVIEIVTFFERMNLSLQFFSARAIQAKDASISFNDALAQGASEAEGLGIWLQRLAVASPFTTRVVSDIFRTAQAYGLTSEEAQKLTPQLLDLGAAAGLNEDILLRVALALGQIRARGKLTGEEVRQLGNSSIPIRDILVKQLGIANEEFDELLESGAFTSDIVIPAIVESLKAFEGAGKRVAFDTIGGIISAFEDLREIGIAKFFTAILAPLRKSFQELFKTLNQPEVLAFIQVLGEEIGVKLRNAVFGVVQTIRDMVAAWRALTPSMQQQIIVFAAATAGVFALTAVLGLLTITVGLLLSPLSLIAITVGFLISEWTSGFGVLRTITASVATAVGRALRSIGQSLQAAIVGFTDFVAGVSESLFGIEVSFLRFGFNIASSLAQGISQGNGLLADAIQGLGSLLTFWLAPGSPPRIAPDIDKWGAMTMQEWANGLGDVDVARPIGPVTKKVRDALLDAGPSFREAGVRTMLEYGKGLVSADFVGPLQQNQHRMVGALSTPEVENAAGAAGIRVSESFINGFLDRLPQLTPKVSEELQKVLNQIGGGTRLTREGANSFGKFLQGFGEADFGVLEETSGIVQGFLGSLVDTGQIEEVDLPRLLFGAREDLAQGIQDIERVGSVTQDTMQRIKSSAGGASKFVLDLLQAYAPLAASTKAVKAAQDVLNETTERYKQILKPLRKELEAINEATKVADEEEKILSLRRLIANEGVSDRRRQNAQLQINQIIAERRVRGLEKERDVAVDSAEEELKAREKTRDAREEEFAELQRNIQAQLDQLGLFGQEASIVRKLREEAAKLREKELTSDQLRMKLLELQSEEMSDLIEAARAKYDLDRTDSTELEKQQAAITLAEVALRRRNREAEAIKLGIPVEELTKLRDFTVTLDDLGIKVKDTFEFNPSTNLNDGLVDAELLTQQWHDTLEQVRKRWTEIKDEINATATAINENLPSFLKIFPEIEGGEPPIIGFIKSYGLAIVGIAVAINTFKIVARLFAVGVAIRNLATLGTISGAAAGAGAAGGAATGAAAVVAAITSSLIAFSTAAIVFVASAVAVAAVIERLQKFAFGRTTIDAAIPLPLPKTKPGTPAEETIEKSFGGDFFTNPFAKTIEDAPTNKQKLVDAYKLLPDEIQAVKDTLNTSLVSLADEEQQRNFAQSIATLINTGVAAGLTDASISKQVTTAFSEGVAAGLVADTESNRQAVATFVADLLALIRQEGEIKSPSSLTEREIGIPFGEGILIGISKAFGQGSTKVVTTAKLMFGDLVTTFTDGKDDMIAIAEMIRLKVSAKFLALKEFLGLRMAEIIFSQETSWTTIRTDTERETETLRQSVFDKFEAIRTNLLAKMPVIKNIVVDAFKQMRIATETEVGTMRTNVVGLLVGEKDSLLNDLLEGFLGVNQFVPKSIGKLFIEGLAEGITENKETLADAVLFAVRDAFGPVANMTSLTGGLSPMESRTGTRPGTHSSATTTNFSYVNHYNLNVTSRLSSQGILQDFAIMRTIGPS